LFSSHRGELARGRVSKEIILEALIEVLAVYPPRTSASRASVVKRLRTKMQTAGLIHEFQDLKRADAFASAVKEQVVEKPTPTADDEERPTKEE
jgi:hypothetical protein